MFSVIATGLLVTACLMGFPILVGVYSNSSNLSAFIYSEVICAMGALVFWTLGYIYRESQLRTRQMFLVTTGTWVTISVFGSLPFIVSDMGMSIPDALFEAVSGLTTTGSTIISGLDSLPRDILIWRSLLQWLGGVGIIAMAVAILPFLRLGGMRLFQTESSDWSQENVGRTSKLVKTIIAIYLLMTVVCIVVYFATGMSWFDAVNHALTTVSTGGYSTSDQSFGAFPSLLTHWCAIFFMVMAALPFFLYARLLQNRKQTRSILKDQQVRGFLKILVSVIALLSLQRILTSDESAIIIITEVAFNITSIVTTTGYASVDYSLWGSFAVAVFFVATFIGGCSGSTSGGTKIFRMQLLTLQLREQLVRAIHPKISWVRTYNGLTVGQEVIVAVSGFLYVMIMSLIVLTLSLTALGLDWITSLTGAATALMNVGPGLGEVIGPAGNFSTVPDVGKLLLCAGMLLGRLEFLSILVLFTRSYWQA